VQLFGNEHRERLTIELRRLVARELEDPAIRVAQNAVAFSMSTQYGNRFGLTTPSSVG
jgi:hypothetical protein